MHKIIAATCYILLLVGCSKNINEAAVLTVSHGSIERIENFQSAYITARHVDVWLPDTYSNEDKYAVLYMHDGQMLFDSTSTWNKQEWGVDEVMSKLLGEGRIRNTIVVGVWNTAFRRSEYFPQKPFESLPKAFQDSLLHSKRGNEKAPYLKHEVQSDNYLRFLVSELKPYIDRTYATLPDKENTFIAGSSMGGLISMYALCEYPEIFQGAGCMSTHWLGTYDTLNNPIPEAFAAYLDSHIPNPEHHTFYFDFGTKTLDAYYEPHQIRIDTILARHGYDNQSWTTMKFEEENHTERAWNKRLDVPLVFLLN